MAQPAILDVIIVGAGPAGGMAAVRLAERGARVLLCERHALPREKACGGALSKSAFDGLIDWDIEPLIEAGARRILLTRDFHDPIERPVAKPVALVNRRDFDFHFIARAQRLGRGNFELRDHCPVAHVAEAADHVAVTLKSGETLRARYVIGADGAAGIVARNAGLAPCQRPGIAIDAEIEIRDSLWAEFHDLMRFDLAHLPEGYGWVFPKNGYLSAGVGTALTHIALPPVADAYLGRLFPDGAILSQRRRGHPIPLYSGPRPLATRRILLAGDAAGLVDPILGEGIRYAIESGAIAAAAIGEQLEGAGTGDAGSVHDARTRDAICTGLERLWRFVYPIYARKPELYYRLFVQENGSAAGFGAAIEARLAQPYG